MKINVIGMITNVCVRYKYQLRFSQTSNSGVQRRLKPVSLHVNPMSSPQSWFISQSLSHSSEHVQEMTASIFRTHVLKNRPRTTLDTTMIGFPRKSIEDGFSRFRRNERGMAVILLFDKSMRFTFRRNFSVKCFKDEISLLSRSTFVFWYFQICVTFRVSLVFKPRNEQFRNTGSNDGLS